ncbi:MAG TPA: glycosyltransferase, partial [Stenomitos sp.]
VGDGSEKPRLVELAQGVSTVRFLDSLPKREIPEVVAAADAYAVTLRDLPLFQGAVPSKLYEAMSAAKPVVLAARGEAPALLAEADAGLSVPPEDAPAFAEAVERLIRDPEMRARLGANGRRLVEDRYDREKLVDRFETMLKEITPHAIG